MTPVQPSRPAFDPDRLVFIACLLIWPIALWLA